MFSRKMLAIIGILIASAVVGWAAEQEANQLVRLSASVGGSYTDNRDSSATDKENCLDVLLRPRIDVMARNERTLLDFYYAPSLRHRDNPSDIQNADEILHQVGLKLEHKTAPRVSLSVDEAFDYTDDPGVQDVGLTRRDYSYILNRASGGLKFEFSRLSYLGVNVNHLMKAYQESEVAEESDVTSLGGGANFWRQFSPTLGCLAGVSVSSYEYNNLLDVERGAQTLSAIVGIENVRSPQFRMGGRLGYQTTGYKDSEMGSSDNPYVALSATFTPIPSRSLTVSALHAVSESSVFPFSIQVMTGINMDLNWAVVPEKFYVSMSGGYGVGSYDEDAAPASAPLTAYAKQTSGDQVRVGVGAGLSYRFNPQCSVSVGQQYEDVDSDVDTSFTRNTTSLSVAYKF